MKLDRDWTKFDISKLRTRDIQLSILAILSKPREEFSKEDARLNRMLLTELKARKQ